MARLSGKAGEVKADATVAATVYGVTNWEIDYKGDAIDTTGMDSAGAKVFIGGLTEISGTVECFHESDHELNTDITPAATILVELYYATGDASAWHGSAVVTDTKPTVQVDGAVKWSITFQGTGAWEYAAP